jgi:hypothetical protein
MELGEPLVDSIGEMLAELFGPITFMEIREGVMYCNGTVFSTTPEFNLQREVEQICIKYDLPIIPRTEIKPVTPILLRDFVKDKPISKHYHEV